MKLWTLKEAERRWGLRSGTLSQCFFHGILPDSCCIWIGFRRAIDPEVMPVIAEHLRRAGKLPKPAVQR